MCVVALTAALVLGCGVGTALAWLSAQSATNNQFVAATVGPTVTEDFPQGSAIKENVAIKNDGNVAVYVRAQVSVGWQDAGGNPLWEQPLAGTDYAMTWGGAGPDAPSNGWTQGADGFYYWTVPLDAAASTGNLIDSCTWLTTTQADGRRLVVDIVVQSVQANPANAVQEAWGATVADDGTLAPRTSTAGAGGTEVPGNASITESEGEGGAA